MLELLGVGKINIALYRVEYGPGFVWIAEYISEVIAIWMVNKASALIININKSYSFEYLKAYIYCKSSTEKALKNTTRLILPIGQYQHWRKAVKNKKNL